MRTKESQNKFEKESLPLLKQYSYKKATSNEYYKKIIIALIFVIFIEIAIIVKLILMIKELL